MYQAKYSIIAIVAIILMGMHSLQQKFPVLSGPYLGQQPPRTTPQIFAPGIISNKGNEGCSVFSQDGLQFIFRGYANPNTSIYFTEQKDGVWSDPQIDPVLDRYNIHDFTLAPDGKTLWFTSRMPLNGEGPFLSRGNIWCITKTESGWTEPKPLVGEINTEEHDSYPSVSREGTLYFFSRRPGGKGQSDLYLSNLIDGKYSNPQNVGAPLNTEYHEWDPFIASDESYLIFCSTKPAGLGEDDLYISFRKEDGAWTESTNMGDKINSSAAENRPYVTLDGKYLFFTSRKSGNREIYWVDAKIIEEIKNR